MDLGGVLKIIISVAFIVYGLLLAAIPEKLWKRSESWKYSRDSKPSAAYMGWYRIVGILLTGGFGVYLVRLIWALCTGGNTDFAVIF